MAQTPQEASLTAAPDSLAADSLAADSIAGSPGMELSYGVVLEAPAAPGPVASEKGSDAPSWVLTGLVAVFVTACLRYRKNTRYFSILIRDFFDMRERHNAFDDTLRETAFLWLLNILWCCSGGVLLYGALCGHGAINPLDSLHTGALGVCMGLALGYTVVLSAAYMAVGSLFSGSAKASLWAKAYLSVQGLEAIVMFPLAILALCTPGLMTPMAVAGAVVFILGKLMFIYKGFCIFFTQTASWVLFLYYLCSLEIVPIVLTYASAGYLCGLV